MARKANTLLMVVICLLFAVDAWANITGNEWKQLGRGEQQGYIMGVVDAWQHLGYAASQSKIQPPSSTVTYFTQPLKCVTQGMTYAQMIAIVQKYLEDNPYQWHYGMSSLIWTALDLACPATGK
jgi:hypothetical protein